MKWIVTAMIASVILPAALGAKGLDKLQPDTEETAANHNNGKTTVDVQATDTVESKEAGARKGASIPAKGTVAKPIEYPPLEPGFQLMYVGSGLSLISTKGPKGSWNSSAAGDLEVGYRVLKQYQDKYDVYGTFRYLPRDVTVEASQRAYRGVIEGYHFGAKGHMVIQPKLFAVASAELGLVRASLHPIDGISKVDAGLAKSGVDLTIGGGVSYLVLDKIALGSQLHLGLGTYNTIQFGADLRFLF